MKFKIKGFISLLLACCFTVAAFSGVILYMTPRGRVANWSGWTMLGLGKHEWSELHMNACALVLVIAAWHLVMNWRVFWSYIKRRSAGLNLKLEMAVALLVTGTLVTGTIYGLPPLTMLAAWNEAIKDSWESQSPRGPAPHAEELTVSQLAGNVGIDHSASPATSCASVSENKAGACADLNGESEGQPTHSGCGTGQGMGAGRGRGDGQGMGGGRGMGAGRGVGAGRGMGTGQGMGAGREMPKTAEQDH